MAADRPPPPLPGKQPRRDGNDKPKKGPPTILFVLLGGGAAFLLVCVAVVVIVVMSWKSRQKAAEELAAKQNELVLKGFDGDKDAQKAIEEAFQQNLKVLEEQVKKEEQKRKEEQARKGEQPKKEEVRKEEAPKESESEEPLVPKIQAKPDAKALTFDEHFAAVLENLALTEPQRLQKINPRFNALPATKQDDIRRVQAIIRNSLWRQMGDEELKLTRAFNRYFHLGQLFTAYVAIADLEGAPNLIKLMKLTETGAMLSFKVDYGREASNVRQNIKQAIELASTRGLNEIETETKTSLRKYREYFIHMSKEPSAEEIARREKEAKEKAEADEKAQMEALAKKEAEEKRIADEKALKEKEAKDKADAEAAEQAKIRKNYAQLVIAKARIEAEAEKLTKDTKDKIEKANTMSKYRLAEFPKVLKNLGLTTAEADALIARGKKEKWPTME
ncbi:hypothetical protein [Zavarzinella formosa]|uniref:hypothetical protein n=1 Tax=Zavarzinella formosa TaxID=360055 RepID=UPI0002DFB283|nr:hypothetical protein [Zavarzinella formosa]